MKKRILWTWMFLGISISCLLLIDVSCTQKRQGQSTSSSDENGQLNSKPGTYTYPHPDTWKSGHVEFFSKYGKAVTGTDQDCAKCHNEKSQKLGTPKNLSCAVQCHTPVATPDGSSPITNPPISEDGKVCKTCHEANFTRHKQHYPATAGLCSTCHTTDPSHLTEKTKKTVTTNKTNSVCLNCHGKMDSHTVVHKALSMNDKTCVYCHDPHGSNNAFFAKDKQPELCIDCHDSIFSDDSKSVHGIITGTDDNKKGCTNCHNPHSTELPKLLKKEKKELCVSCHDREYQSKYSDGSARVIPNIKQKIKGSNAHPIAVSEANCTKCHSPHSSQYGALLMKKYPVTPYEKYTPKVDKNPDSYELCFTCHDETMLKKDIEVEDTYFRNDTKDSTDNVTRQNLHWFHVVSGGGQDPEKGRSCFVCHDPHGSEQKHMIKSSFRLNGNTQVKVEYKATKLGGECANTCHGTKQYNRID